MLPYSLNLGYSWRSNKGLFIVYDGENYTGNRTFTILKKETLNIPYGTIEAYKITYTGSFEEWVGPIIVPDKLTVNGTVWIHPKIGIVKIEEYAMKQVAWMEYYYSYKNELVAINFSIH